jgi:hypothetical protein
MTLMQASYLYTDSLLRGVTIEVLPLSSHARSPKMLPLLEIFLEYLLWNIFQCYRHFLLCLHYPKLFVPLRQTLWKQPQVIRIKIRGIGHVFHCRNRFLGQKLLDRAGAFSWWGIQLLGQSSGLFIRRASHNRFIISTYKAWFTVWPCGMNSE